MTREAIGLTDAVVPRERDSRREVTRSFPGSVAVMATQEQEPPDFPCGACLMP